MYKINRGLRACAEILSVVSFFFVDLHSTAPKSVLHHAQPTAISNYT